MPKPIVFQFGDRDISFDMNKVDRSKLYGFKEVQALDETGNACQLATLAGDGCTLIGKGGTGLGWLDADGCWRDKAELVPVDKNGSEIQPVTSSFAAPIKLFDTATIEEYLEHDIRLLYHVQSLSDAEDLEVELRRGTIFVFSYSYRGGLEADIGFLLANELGEMMLAIGNRASVEFVGLAAPAATVSETDDADDVDLMDFDMI